MIRVIASDYDGTFGTHLGIPAENIEAVRRWQKAGNIFCVLTGREPLSAIDVLKQFGGVYDYLLACSGAVQMDAQNEIFHMEKQSAHLLPEIASYTLTLPVLNFRVFVGKERHRLYIPGREHDSEAGNAPRKTWANCRILTSSAYYLIPMSRPKNTAIPSMPGMARILTPCATITVSMYPWPASAKRWGCAISWRHCIFRPSRPSRWEITATMCR